MDTPQLSELLSRWDRARQEGQPLSAEELCRDCPDLVSQLQQEIAALIALAGFRPGTGRSDDASTVPPGDGNPPPPSIPGYEILGILGRGGMGVVFDARQLAAGGRPVALKMIRRGVAADSDDLVRFRTEITAASRLQHPNIVQIHEVGSHEGSPFFSMQRCAGGSLKDRLAGTPIPSDEGARLTAILADAVQHAHEQGVVHRDLKPANVLLGHPPGRPVSECEPRVSDFGLAKRLDADAGQTQPGDILGTPSYMAPEQARGGSHQVGPAADVYALGAILYECLTGRPPFKAATSVETVLHVIEKDPVPPRTLQPGVPRDLDTICLKCLQKDPARRYGSARDLADDLRRFLKGEPIRARPVGRLEVAWRWCRRNPTAAALGFVTALTVLLLAVGLPALYFAMQAADEALQLKRSQEYVAILNGVRHDIARPRLGWTWACLDNLQTASRLDTPLRNLIELRTEATATLAGIDLKQESVPVSNFRAGNIAFSPDGRTLAVVPLDLGLAALGKGEVRLIDLADGREQRLPVPAKTDDDRAFCVAFSPDARWLLVGTRSGHLHRFDLSRSESQRRPERLYPPNENYPPAIEQMSFAPDSRTLFTHSYGGLIRMWDVETLGKPLCEYKSDEYRPSFSLSPDGRLVVCHARGETRFLDAGTLLPSRAPREIDFHASCFSPDGKRLAVAAKDSIRILDVDGESPDRVLTDPRLDLAHLDPVQQLQFNADGSLLLSVCENRGECKLWETAGGRLVATLLHAEKPTPPLRACFNPAGNVLAVAVNRQVALYRIGGLAEQTAVAHHAEPLWDFAFSADGASLACLSAPVSRERTQGHATLWHLLSGRQLERQTVKLKEGIREPASLAFHPRTGTLVYGAEQGRVRDWNPGVTDERPAFLEKGLANGVFSPDGKRLWAVVNEDTVRSWDGGTYAPASEWKNSGAVPTGIRSLAVGNRWVVAGCRDRATRLLRAGVGKLAQTWARLPGPVTAVALSPDETLAASGSQDGAVRVVRVPGGETVAEWADHRERVSAIAFSPDGRLLVTGSEDGTVRVSFVRGESIGHLLTLPATGPVQQVRFHPDGVRLGVLVSRECAIRVWHLDRLQDRLAGLGLGAADWPAAQPWALQPTNPPPAKAAPPLLAREALARGELLIAQEKHEAGLLWLVRALETAAKEPGLEPGLRRRVGAWFSPPRNVNTFAAHDGKILGVAVCPDGALLATAGEDRVVRIWDTRTLQKRAEYRHEATVRGVAFLREGGRVVSWGDDGTVRVAEAATGKPVGEPLRHDSHVYSVSITRDDRWLASAGRAETVFIWDLDRVLKGGSSSPTLVLSFRQPLPAVCFTPDGGQVLVGLKGALQFRDTVQGVPAAESLAVPGQVASVAVCSAATGRSAGAFVTGTPDGAFLWHPLASGLVRTALPHPKGVECVAWSPDGRLVATAGTDDTARLWDAETGIAVCLPLAHPKTVYSAAFTPKGQLVTGCHDGTVRIWGPVPQPIVGSAEQVALLAQAHVGMELTPDGLLHALPKKEMPQVRIAPPEPPAPRPPIRRYERVVRRSPPHIELGHILTAGSTGQDAGTAVLAAPDGGVFLAGIFSGTIDLEPGTGKGKLTSRAKINHFVARLGSDRKLVWARQFGEKEEMEDNVSLALDTKGNLFVAGSFFGKPNLGAGPLENAGSLDIYLAKLDRDGEVVWTQSYGGTAADAVAGVATDREDNVYLCGRASGENLVGGDKLAGFVAKVKGDGKVLWSRPLSGQSSPTCMSVAVDPHGDVVVAGVLTGTVDFDPGPGKETRTAAGRDAFVWKLTPKGELVWVRTWGGGGTDGADSVVTDRHGNIFVGGEFSAEAEFGPFTLRSSVGNAFLVKLNPAGEVRWARAVVASMGSRSLAVAVDKDGNVFTTGYVEGEVDLDPGPDVLPYSGVGKPDIFISRLDAAGNFVWSRAFGSTGLDKGNAIAVDGDGNVWVTGNYWDKIDFAPKGGAGGYDIFLLQLSQKRLQGVVWHDKNGDGCPDADEPPVEGAVAELFDGEASLGTAVTNAEGEYRFLAPPAAEKGYRLVFRLPPGFRLAGEDTQYEVNGETFPDVAVVTGDMKANALPGTVTKHDGARNRYVAGRFSGKVDFDARPGGDSRTSRGGDDAFVAKYTPAGALIWAAVWGGDGDDDVTAVTVDAEGNVCVSGTFTGCVNVNPGAGFYHLFGGPKPEPFMLELDPSGKFLWAWRSDGR